MATSRRARHETVERARAWHNGRHAGLCDVVEPWAHGTVVRATRYPDFYDFNLVRVEGDPGLSVDALVSFADRALAGLEHRQLEFEFVDAAEPLRSGFEAQGWMAERSVKMRFETPPPSGPAVDVEELPYDAVHELRVAWSREESPDQDPSGFLTQMRDVALRRDTRVLAVRREGVPVAFAQLERVGDAAEVAGVYVGPEFRGRGFGTALTCAAIEAARAVADLWIDADDEDRPKELYARLGFSAVWTRMVFTRLP